MYLYMFPRLCEYKNLFGEPGTGIHKTRIMGVGLWDVVFTILGALIVAYATGWPVVYTILGTFATGIVVHRAFCVRTAVDKFLFP